MFCEKKEIIDGRHARVITGLGYYSLKDTMECGQCFRYELIENRSGFTEYITIVKDLIIDVAQRESGELIFFDINDKDFNETAAPYFSLYTDFEAIRQDIIKRTDSDWLKQASESAKGIAILKQDPWEALLSFIISQNNNIPRIRKIIRAISSQYGVNICLQNGMQKCPAGKIDVPPCEEFCQECGICYTFPSAKAVNDNPEKLLKSNPGFRYKYMCDAAKKIDTGAINLQMIEAARSYEHTRSCLLEILGVGEKVAACVALFGIGNLEAFPIDVWMKRAIDQYFDGKLDPTSLGRYAGVAQQYIFHYIRNLSAEDSTRVK